MERSIEASGIAIDRIDSFIEIFEYVQTDLSLTNMNECHEGVFLEESVHAWYLTGVRPSH